jgi:hypothetical protein
MPQLQSAYGRVVRNTPLAWATYKIATVFGVAPPTLDVRAEWRHPVGYYYSYANRLGWLAGSHIDPTVRETLYLVGRYAPGRNRLVLLVRPDSATEALIRLRATSVFPVADAPIESASPTASARAMRFPLDLAPGDVVFVQLGYRKALFGVQKGILRRLCAEFAFEQLQAMPSGVAALRLGTEQERQSRPTADWIRPELCDPLAPRDTSVSKGPDPEDE